MEPSSDRQTEDLVLDLAHFLDETGARDIVALDVSEQSSFARYFIIGGAVSAGQLRGLKRRAHERLGELGLRARQSPKRDDESGWLLIDCDDLIVHLMLDEQRQFYELEKLWFDARILYRSEEENAGASAET